MADKRQRKGRGEYTPEELERARARDARHRAQRPARGEMTPEQLERAHASDRRHYGKIAGDKRTVKYHDYLADKAAQQKDRRLRDPAEREANRQRSQDWRARMTREQYEQYLAGQRERNRDRRQRLKSEAVEREERAEIAEESHYEWLLELYETGLKNLRAVEASMAPARRESAIRNLNTIYAELTELAERINRRRRERGED